MPGFAEVITLGRLSPRRYLGQLEPSYTQNAFPLPVNSPGEPQNLLRATLMNTLHGLGGVVVEDVALGNLGKVRRMLGLADVPAIPSSSDTAPDAVQTSTPPTDQLNPPGQSGAYAERLIFNPWINVLRVASSAAGAYHGYRRNQSVGWAIWWSLMGGMFPVVTPAIAAAQGFGKRKTGR